MKKLIFFLSIFFLNFNLILADNCVTAKNDCHEQKTFFRPRTAIEDVTLFLGMNNYQIYQKYLDIPVIQDSKEIYRDENFYFHGGIFFEQSIKSKDLKKYFFPNGIVSSTNNLINEMQNYLICPTREVVGLVLNYHQDFCFLENLWIDARFAIYRAKHTFLLECKDCCNKSNDFLKKLNFDKISLCPLKKIGIDDIQVELGYTAYKCEENADYLNVYGSLIIPTASKPKGDFLFEPLVGRSHWALGVGLNGGLQILERPEDKRYVAIMADLSYQYLFQGSECRLVNSTSKNMNDAIDIINEVSNFIDTDNNEDIQNKINQFKSNFLKINSKKLEKHKLKVTPGSIINLWLAMHYQHYSWNIELGYNLWWKDNEKVCLEKCIKNAKNLNLASAAQPSALSNKIYGLMGYFTTLANHIIPLYFGAAYEFAKDKNALEQWEVWLGAEFSF